MEQHSIVPYSRHSMRKIELFSSSTSRNLFECAWTGLLLAWYMLKFIAFEWQFQIPDCDDPIIDIDYRHGPIRRQHHFTRVHVISKNGLLWWWQNLYAGAVFNVKNPSSTSQIGHQHKSSPTSITDIDVTVRGSDPVVDQTRSVSLLMCLVINWNCQKWFPW